MATTKPGSAAPSSPPVAAERLALLSELRSLPSEERNPRTTGIDLMSTAEILAVINDEDRIVPEAVQKTLPEVARAVEAIVAAFGRGGRLVYIGAGTSGRLGVLDASECPPTFGVSPELVVGLIAGGKEALVRAAEGIEDQAEAGADDLRAIGLTERDVVVGIAVSGRTPYVIGALGYARTVGAVVVGLTCNPASAIARMVDISIAPVVGAEVVTGSTRLKSGTAQKLVLNMLTTVSMIRIGKTYQNLMVDLHASNAKLLARAVQIVMQATDCTATDAEAALARTGNDVKLAILTTLTGKSVEDARAAIDGSGGVLRRALEDAGS
ncbi:MAG TPA: N-acetylmuramic acid 6-phosphate etherase [Devosiaceae bacterium]|jgi:N-acetylmuramic acid 6-phosphate etherase|nr:N-acetylmuramic acid 6-phosphate etherase [Devosiaceae bacterium]